MVPRFYKRPWIIIAVCAVITVFFGLQLPHLKIESSSRDFLPKSGESYLRFNQCEDEFGSMDLIGISLETEDESILTPEYLTVVGRIAARIENLSDIEKVDAISNIDFVTSEDNSLVATNLIDEELYSIDENGNPVFTGTKADIRKINQKLIEWEEMYDRVMISDDGRATQMQIVISENRIDSDGNSVKISNSEKNDILQSVKKIVSEEVSGTGLNQTVYGDTVVSDEAHTFMVHDLVCLIPLVVLVVSLSLFFSFKTTDGTLLPLLTVLISTIWSCGLMSLLHFTFTIVSSIIPVALIAVGSAYGIHVLTHYYIALEKNDKPMTKELHAEIIWSGVKEVFGAVFLAGLTTVVGFISLVTSPLEPLHSFAIFASLGVLFSLLLALTLVPALLMTKPVNLIGKKSDRMEAIIARAKRKASSKLEKIHSEHSEERKAEVSTYYSLFRFFAGTKPRLILLSLAIVICSVIGIKKLVIDTAMINYFPATSRLRRDIDYVNKRFAGTNSVYIIVSADSQNSAEAASGLDSDGSDDSFDDLSFDDFGGFDDFNDFTSEETDFSDEPIAASVRHDMTNPEILYAMEGLQNRLLEEYQEVGKVVSFTTFLKRMNQVMNAPSSDSAETADDVANLSKNASVQELLELFSEAYADAGGNDATVGAMMSKLLKKFNYNGTDYYEIPYDAEKYPVESREELADLVSQYIMLLGGDSLNRFVVPQGSFTPTKMRIQVQLRTHSTDSVGEIIAYAKEYVANHFPEGYTVEYTGTSEMEYTMTGMVISSQFTSLLLSLLSVFIIISISFKSGIAGLIGAIPLAFTIILNYMIMGLTGIKLDLITSIIASVAIGVGIDYTIHFLETYRAERANSDDLELVVKRTFNKSGVGIVTNALAVGLGFLVLCLSQFIVLRYIGILVAIVMFSSSALAMTIIPGILHLYDFKFMKPKTEQK